MTVLGKAGYGEAFDLLYITSPGPVFGFDKDENFDQRIVSSECFLYSLSG